jgi:hypothetical protein
MPDRETTPLDHEPMIYLDKEILARFGNVTVVDPQPATTFSSFQEGPPLEPDLAEMLRFYGVPPDIIERLGAGSRSQESLAERGSGVEPPVRPSEGQDRQGASRPLLTSPSIFPEDQRCR